MKRRGVIPAFSHISRHKWFSIAASISLCWMPIYRCVTAALLCCKRCCTRAILYTRVVRECYPFSAAQKKRGLILDKVCRWPDGKEVQPGYITHAFPKVLKRHGLNHIRFHDLRGTAASLMAQHAKPKQLQEFMGHNKISTTMEIYVKAFDDDRKAVAGFMNSILEKSPSCSKKCSDWVIPELRILAKSSKNAKKTRSFRFRVSFGGDKRARTADLLNAMASLVYTNEYNPSISSK